MTSPQHNLISSIPLPVRYIIGAILLFLVGYALPYGCPPWGIWVTAGLLLVPALAAGWLLSGRQVWKLVGFLVLTIPVAGLVNFISDGWMGFANAGFAAIALTVPLLSAHYLHARVRRR